MINLLLLTFFFFLQKKHFFAHLSGGLNSPADEWDVSLTYRYCQWDSYNI